jgi:inositol phosphorylceramide mannosyltransferase catalytic subunit
MAIPKIIYQTYVNNKLPLITRFFMWWMRKRNPDYRYEFYDDQRIEDFLKSEYPDEIYKAYKKLAIGAAKADFFRYAILYKTGGVYVDIDGAVLRPLSLIIKPDDEAIITRERNPGLYVQWALIYGKEHPIIKRTMEKCVDNISNNRFPYRVEAMTGPPVYSQAIEECIVENPQMKYRIFGTDYERKVKQVIIPKHFLNSIIYFRKEHWMKQQLKRPVLKEV